MKGCAMLPFGAELYQFLQFRFGRLAEMGMLKETLQTHAEMIAWLAKHGVSPLDKTVLEVGTGHVPTVPLGFALCGAARVYTFDLNRRMRTDLLHACVEDILRCWPDISELYSPFIDGEVLNQRKVLLEKKSSRAESLLSSLGIKYLAPADAARTSLADSSVDIHVSKQVFGYIPGSVLQDIMSEATRVLRPDGVALHFIDLSDHFSHRDSSISAIHFLSYTAQHWQALAGNQFAYCNRLRRSDYLSLFEELGFSVEQSESVTDNRARKEIANGFAVDEVFQQCDLDDLCTTRLRVLLRPGKKDSGK